MRKKYYKRIPKGERRELTRKDIMERLRDIWAILDLRVNCGELSPADEEMIRYNFQLADFYFAFERRENSRSIGFCHAEADEDEDGDEYEPEEDEDGDEDGGEDEFFVCEVYGKNGNR